MKVLKYLAILVWRIWFYVWFMGTIILVLPILLVITWREEWYPTFYKIARAWGKTLLFVMGFKAKPNFEQKIEYGKSYMFCANHTSIIDIMLVLSVVKTPLVFVGKAELGKIPVFGYIYKRTCILVDRANLSSRKAVFEEAERKLKRGLSVCIFPEGKVPDDESVVLDEFKNGAFILAIDHNIPIVPMTFYDCKERFSYTFFSGSPGDLRVKVHPFVETLQEEISSKKIMKKKVHSIIYNDLIADKNLER
jgi:1-acyl-sn-glycerol-3-phosphate acyltransferase